MKTKSSTYPDDNNVVSEVMTIIKVITELDHSPNFQLSKEYYEKNQTFNGIIDFLKSYNNLNDPQQTEQIDSKDQLNIPRERDHQ